MEYVKRIRDLREDNDKTQLEIAQMLETSQTMYARYERGANELPIRHLLALADYYNVSTDYILGRTDNPAFNWNIKMQKNIDFLYYSVIIIKPHIMGSEVAHRARLS